MISINQQRKQGQFKVLALRSICKGKETLMRHMTPPNPPPPPKKKKKKNVTTRN